MPTLAIMCGVPASGKSYYAQRHFQGYDYISRDHIRFGLLRDNEPYFSHEDEVYTIFIQMIVASLKAGRNVVADATHLNRFSRRNLMAAIDHENDFANLNIEYFCFESDLNLCLQRNSQRVGREKVPDDVITRMWHDYHRPDKTEDNRISNIFVAIEKE